MPKTQRKRLNLDLPQTVVDGFDQLMELSGSESRSEVIRKSLRFFEAAMQHQAHGGKVLLEHPDGQKETLRIL